MRKLLLASMATLGAAGLSGVAYAQSPLPPIPGPMPTNPVQGGFVSAPLASPPVGANNNNNSQAPALPGVAANPTPGTVVRGGWVRLNSISPSISGSPAGC